MSDLEEPRLHVAGRVVADYVLDPDIAPTLVPRPYLHPVRTLAGTVVSDALPADHEWHLGVGLAIADVAGTNLWGGRSYVHGKGYVWLPDHGRIDHVAWRQHTDDVLEHDLVWRDHDGAELLTEHRTMSSAPTATADSWILTFATTLRNVRPTPIELRSPATNGRGDGAGYGGFFWRLPSTQDMKVEARDPDTADRARGEDFVNGSALPELRITGTTTPAGAGVGGTAGPAGGAISGGGVDGTSGPTGGAISSAAAGFGFTLTGLAGADRWFVRVAEYPAVGIAFASNHPVVLAPGAALARTFSITVADG